MLVHQICGDGSRMGYERHMMRCVGRRVGEVKEIHSGGMKR